MTRLALLLLLASAIVQAQVAPEATRGILSSTVGVSVSRSNVIGGAGALYGGTAWTDLHLHFGLDALSGLSLEALASDRYLGSPTFDNVAIAKETVFLGGPVYRWNHYDRFRPFADFLAGLGFARFKAACCAAYTHDKREVWAWGGGVDWIAGPRTTLRADYRREYWPALFTPNPLAQSMVEVGLSYQLHRIRRSF